MKKWLLVVALVLYLGIFSSQAYAISGLIGHFDDTSWSGLSSSSGYNDIEVDITPQVWNGGNDAYYYSLSPYFTNGNFIYGGLQTNGNDGTKAVGKMLIFSIWNTSSGIPEPGGTGVQFGGEGSGYSVRLAYNWTVGTTYRFKINIYQDASSGNRLWAAYVTNLSTNQAQRIGRIYAPVSFGKIYAPVTFQERYLGSSNSCSDLSPSQVSFANMAANGATIHATGWSHYYAPSIPACANDYWTQDSSSGYVSAVGIAKAVAHPSPPPPTTPAPKPTTSTPSPSSTTQPSDPSAPPPLAAKTTAPTLDLPKQTGSTAANPKTSYSVPIGISVSLGVVAGGIAFVSYRYHKFRKLRRFFEKHFPYDFDIHGPKHS